MKKLIILLGFCSISVFLQAQINTLNPLSAQYFTQSQKDTMSQKFIQTQNYLACYSWNIYRRWDKRKDSIVVFSCDTIDIRPYLTSRKENQPVWIYDIYPGLVIELDSKEAVRYRIAQIYGQ